MPPKLHEAAAAPESSHSCCVGKYGNTTVQVMHNARHRPLLPACAQRPPVSFSAQLFHRVPGPCVQIAKRRGCAWAGGFYGACAAPAWPKQPMPPGSTPGCATKKREVE